MHPEHCSSNQVNRCTITSTSFRMRFSMSLDREFQDGRFTIGQCAAHLHHPAELNRMHARIQRAVRLGLIVRDGHGFRLAPHAWELVRRRLEEC